MEQQFTWSSSLAFFSQWSSSLAFNNRPIYPEVQIHLKKVYLSLCCTVMASALGAYMHILMSMGGLLTTAGCLGCVFFFLLFNFTTQEHNKWVMLVMAAALLGGASLGSFSSLGFDPSILVIVLVGIALAFGCFSAASTVVERTEFLWLGGLVTSAISILMWLQFAAFIFGNSTIKIELYFGLLMFVRFIISETEVIIDRVHLQDLNYLNDAVTLFTDLIFVFVRFIAIMMKNSFGKK